MSLTTYAELKASILDWLNRDDIDAAPFVTLAEADLATDVEHWRREKRATATAGSRYLELPSDFHRPIRFHVKDAKDPLQPMSQNEMAHRRAEVRDTTGTPCHYVLTGGEIELFPTPAEALTVEMSYSAIIPALSDSNTSNWLLERFPNAYLYGALKHTSGYLREDGRAQLWAAYYQASIDAIRTDSRAAKWGGNLRIRSN
jgi:hypothetical protein